MYMGIGGGRGRGKYYNVINMLIFLGHPVANTNGELISQVFPAPTVNYNSELSGQPVTAFGKKNRCMT